MVFEIIELSQEIVFIVMVLMCVWKTEIYTIDGMTIFLNCYAQNV
jgi:hypothetical protein